jgi:hypothetical protein
LETLITLVLFTFPVFSITRGYKVCLSGKQEALPVYSGNMTGNHYYAYP